MSKVSIIMPAYNSALYIEESIKSVLAQTYTDWELIIIDDGSTDNTEHIVRRCAATNPKIFYYKQSNQGQAIARNKGIDLSSGHLIAFLDSDDLWLPGTLERLCDTLLNQKVDFVFCSFSRLINNDYLREESLLGFPIGKLNAKQMIAILSLYNPLVIHGVVTYRQFVIDAGGFEINPKLLNCSEDYSLWIKIALLNKMFFGLPERLAIYRWHDAGTHTNRIKMLEAELFVHRKYIQADSQNVRIAKRLLRSKYRRLISAYLKAQQIENAKKTFRELLKFDKYGFTGRIISGIAYILPFSMAHTCGTKLIYPIEYRVMNFLYGKLDKAFAKYKDKVIHNK
jgi:glycosyltransferase involved in cell wall biosynthesis